MIPGEMDLRALEYSVLCRLIDYADHHELPRLQRVLADKRPPTREEVDLYLDDLAERAALQRPEHRAVLDARRAWNAERDLRRAVAVEERHQGRAEIAMDRALAKSLHRLQAANG